ncbi:MAG: DUF378 domain-containing protein [Candidatus Paceibacterota bacterium]
MKSLHFLTFILLVVGGLNWLLVGVFSWNLVEFITGFFGSMGGTIATIIYALVGLSAIYEVLTHKKKCNDCVKPGMGGQM